MGQYVDEHILTWVISLPAAAVGALLVTGLISSIVFGTKGLPGVVWRAVGVFGSALTFLFALLGLGVRFDAERTGYQFVEWRPWIPDHGIHYFVGVDGISLLLVLLTTFLVPVVLLASWKQVKTFERSFVVLLLTFESAALLTLCSLNFMHFYLGWALMQMPMCFIVGIWGGPRRIYAALKFALFAGAGSLLMLAVMLVLYRLNFEQSGVPNFDLVSLPDARAASGLSLIDTALPLLGSDGPWWSSQRWLFAGLALAFGISLPVLPLHSWLTDAEVEAPVSGSAVLAGVLSSMGSYGLLRLVLPLFPDVSRSEGVVTLALLVGLTGVVYASSLALVQQDLRRLLAYASIAQLSLALIGIVASNLHGLTGALILLVSHGLTSGGLYLLVGFIYERRQSYDIAEFGGVAKPMPIYAALFGLMVLGGLGMPMLSGFVGEFLILLGAFGVSARAGAGAALAATLAAICLSSMYRRVMFGPVENPSNRGLIDLGWRERVVGLALALPVVWIGVYPNPVLRRVEPAVMELLRIMDERSTGSSSEMPSEKMEGAEGEGADGVEETVGEADGASPLRVEPAEEEEGEAEDSEPKGSESSSTPRSAPEPETIL